MARSPSKKTSLTSKPAVVRQARRLNKQQKHLEKELMASSVSSSPYIVGAKSRSITIGDVKEIQPQTETQEAVFEGYYDTDALALIGSAGTGKSFCAIYLALLDILDPESPFDKIVILRSTAQSREIGFLPGDLIEKIEPFEEPYRAILDELVGRKDAYDKLKDMGMIEFACTSFLRGITFNNAIVIFDELQNETFHSISTIATRVGKNCKIVFIGDGGQTDISKSKTDMSGFADFVKVANSMAEFRTYRFTTDDIVRSGFCRSWIVACERLNLV